MIKCGVDIEISEIMKISLVIKVQFYSYKYGMIY